MSTEDISLSDTAPGNDAAPTPIELRDDGVSESTASIIRDILNALAKDIQQLNREPSEFEDISFGDPAPENVAALTRAWREGKDVVLSIKRQFGYVVSSKRYAQDLQNEVQTLAYEAKRVQNAVEEARNNRRNVYGLVTESQGSAEKVLTEAEDLLGDLEKASKTCCYGTLPNPNSLYRFSRKAKEKIEDMRQLAQELSELKGISFSDPSPGNVAAPTPARGEGKEVVHSTTPTASASSASTATKLRDDDVFKSHNQVVFPNLRNIEWDSQVYFQRLKTLDVSYCHQLTNIFTPTIARNLMELTKLRISNCEMLTEVISDEGGKEGHAVAFNQLKSMDLDGLIGLRCFSSGRHTLMFPLLEDVIVTRCPNMKFFSEGPIETPKLEKVQVSMTEWVWNRNLNITIQNMYQEMAMVAGVKLVRLSEFPELIEEWHSKLLPIEPFSELEMLVVDKCPSFTNAIPSTSMLALHNMRSLQVRDCESLEEIFDLEGLKGVESTQVLPQLSLLGLVDLPKLRRLWDKNLQGRLCFNSLSHLTLHRCSNLRHPFTSSMVQCLATLEDLEIKECGEVIGVIGEEEELGKITFPNLLWMKLECLPRLTSILSGQNCTLEFPHLKGLTIVRCPNIYSFSDEYWLKNHRSPLSRELVLNFHHLNISPKEISQVAFPSLEAIHITGMDNIKMIGEILVDADAFHGLKSLFVRECNTLEGIWHEKLHNQIKFQCLRSVSVSVCKSLTSLFPAPVARDLIQLEELEIEECGIEELIEKDELVPRFVFPKLTSLTLKHLPRLRRIHTGIHPLHWPALKSLKVHGCVNVEILASQPEGEMTLRKQPLFLTEKDAFPSLETLCITLMDKMEMLSDTQVHFQQLKTLDVSHCGRLPYMFTPTIAENLVELAELKISNCNMLKEVISDEGGKEGSVGASNELKNTELDRLAILRCFLPEEGQGSAVETIRFPNLLRVELEYLPNLTSFFAGNNRKLEWPNLEELTIANCPKMTRIGMPFPRLAYFQHLKTLDVSYCDWLPYVFTRTIAENLVELAELKIRYCKILTEVISDGGGKERGAEASNQLTNMEHDRLTILRCFAPEEGQGSAVETIRFPNLLRVDLECLPNLTNFLAGDNRKLEWPKLEELTIANCPKMTRIGTLFPRPPSFISRLCTDI